MTPGVPRPTPPSSSRPRSTTPSSFILSAAVTSSLLQGPHLPWARVPESPHLLHSSCGHDVVVERGIHDRGHLRRAGRAPGFLHTLWAEPGEPAAAPEPNCHPTRVALGKACEFHTSVSKETQTGWERRNNGPTCTGLSVENLQVSTKVRLEHLSSVGSGNIRPTHQRTCGSQNYNVTIVQSVPRKGGT